MELTSTNANVMEPTPTREFVVTSLGVGAYVEVQEKHFLSDVRNTLIQDLDQDQLPDPDFAFLVNDIRISKKQESRKLAFDILNQNARVELISRPKETGEEKPKRKATKLNNKRVRSKSDSSPNPPVECQPGGDQQWQSEAMEYCEANTLGRKNRFESFNTDAKLIQIRMDSTLDHRPRSKKTVSNKKVKNDESNEEETVRKRVSMPRCILCHKMKNRKTCPAHPKFYCPTCKVHLCMKVRENMNDTCFALFHKIEDLSGLLDHAVGEKASVEEEDQNNAETTSL